VRELGNFQWGERIWERSEVVKTTGTNEDAMNISVLYLQTGVVVEQLSYQFGKSPIDSPILALAYCSSTVISLLFCQQPSR